MTTNDSRLLILENQGAMADYMVTRWTEILKEAIDRRGRFVAALSGGGTPAGFYRKLAVRGPSLPWDKTFLFLVDERFVPATDPDSNYRMIADTLLRRVDIPADNVYPVPCGENEPALAAERYQRQMIRFFGLGPGTFPEFDLIMLGMGEDGHTASLFPGTGSVSDSKRLALAVAAGGIGHERITLTLPVINRARRVIFLVNGRNKAQVLREVLEDKTSRLPAALVKPESGNLLFVVDREAAALLTATNRESIPVP